MTYGLWPCGPPGVWRGGGSGRRDGGVGVGRVGVAVVGFGLSRGWRVSLWLCGAVGDVRRGGVLRHCCAALGVGGVGGGADGVGCAGRGFGLWWGGVGGGGWGGWVDGGGVGGAGFWGCAGWGLGASVCGAI